MSKRRKKYVKKSDQKKAWAKGQQKERAYKTNQREKEKVFYIVCEGENTEPEYFKAFPLTNAQVNSFGLGQTKRTLVETIIELRKQKTELENYELWCVFDMDIDLAKQGQREDFNEAIKLAKRSNIKVAYSNDAFELWFILHYEFIDDQRTRHEYYKRLSVLWDVNYDRAGKSILFCKKNYKRLFQDERADQKRAIQFAKKLQTQFKEENYCDKNPCTSVHNLVTALSNYL